jgi:segregation and condensation protein A
MTYRIQLDQFEGPFDLLLFFIQRDELDIYDIPIAKITNDFLSYIRQMEALNVDLASEFIWVAASLMRIKAKMLLPRRDIDESGEEIDPREELVQRLLEYKKYKATLDEFRELERQRRQKIRRGNTKKELESMAASALEDAELESLSLYRLMTAFDRLMDEWKRTNVRRVHTVIRYQFTIKDQHKRIRTILQTKGRANFDGLFKECENRIHAIVTFLALLEMANRHEIHIYPGEGYNSFEVHPKSEEEEG